MRDYLIKGDRCWTKLLLLQTNISCIGYSLAYLRLTLAHSEGQTSRSWTFRLWLSLKWWLMCQILLLQMQSNRKYYNRIRSSYLHLTLTHFKDQRSRPLHNAHQLRISWMVTNNEKCYYCYQTRRTAVLSIFWPWPIMKVKVKVKVRVMNILITNITEMMADRTNVTLPLSSNTKNYKGLRLAY